MPRRDYTLRCIAREGDKGVTYEIVHRAHGVIGKVVRASRPSGLGYRSGSYHGYLADRGRVASGDRLDDIRTDLDAELEADPYVPEEAS